ncbi:MAG: (Fe-S)-binding protein [Eggerthellaceae bacterium]|nr:(Fe-S)-binding protein [Eggerthellaceae bacterium]
MIEVGTMDEYTFEDALASCTVTCAFPGLEATRIRHEGTADKEGCTSLFFPGCSFLNYGLPLVKAVYDLLEGAGQADGISLLCCGKILAYEGDGGAARAAFEQQFRERITATGIRRIVAACPNCVESLRGLLAGSAETAKIEVVALPAVLVELGYRVDAQIASDLARQDERIGNGNPVFCVKDSCPDRATGEFADALRAIMPPELIVEPAHNRKRSICCGSKPRAAGQMDAAQKCASRNGQEALEADANALVTACMSCTFLLSLLQKDVPVFHYLELLFNWRIGWDWADQYMKLRFLFDDALGTREFTGIG